nr:MAG TPA: hypothetical protein [Caudoviricetes sp.]
MAEYIEREKLYNNLILLAKYETGERQQGILGCAETVRIVSAADVAPVVRCKDCAHRTEMGNCGHPRYHGILPSAYPYDFCSYGERNEND